MKTLEDLVPEEKYCAAISAKFPNSLFVWSGGAVMLRSAVKLADVANSISAPTVAEMLELSGETFYIEKGRYGYEIWDMRGVIVPFKIDAVVYQRLESAWAGLVDFQIKEGIIS